MLAGIGVGQVVYLGVVGKYRCARFGSASEPRHGGLGGIEGKLGVRVGLGGHYRAGDFDCAVLEGVCVGLYGSQVVPGSVDGRQVGLGIVWVGYYEVFYLFVVVVHGDIIT